MSPVTGGLLAFTFVLVGVSAYLTASKKGFFASRTQKEALETGEESEENLERIKTEMC